MEIKDFLSDIEDMMNKEYNVQISQENKNQMTMALKKIYGTAYRSGMAEGAEVSKKFENLKNNA